MFDLALTGVYSVRRIAIETRTWGMQPHGDGRKQGQSIWDSLRLLPLYPAEIGLSMQTAVCDTKDH
jgi:hypothetical protein